jgi:hypothetical protein
MSISTEFSDYDLSTLPAIPAGWIDESWHNDAMPQWRCGHLWIQVDYADPDMRETKGHSRFCVYRYTDPADPYGESVIYLTTDDWRSVLVFVSAYMATT